MKNALKTTLLLATISGLFLAIGYFAGGQSGLLMAFLLSMAINFGSYWFSHKIVLRMHNTKEITEVDHPTLFGRVKRLAQSAQLPMPSLHIYDSPQPNAFATGRSPETGVVALSTGIMRLLDDHELDGVIAHELAHIKNRDMLVSSIAATFATAISYLGNLVFFLPSSSDEEGGNPWYSLFAIIAAPIIAMLIQMGISRTREFGADATGAQIAGSPHGLAGALLKLEQSFSNQARRGEPALAQASTAHLYISNPLKGNGLAKLFSTHPPTEERVRKLRELI